MTFASPAIETTAQLAAEAFDGGTVFVPSFTAPPGGTDLAVQGSKSFVAPVAGTYTVSFLANSFVCDGCEMSYEVFVDDVLLTSTFAPSNTSLVDSRSIDVVLGAGSHELTLGMRTTNASSGTFGARFDDVVVSTDAAVVPLPAAGLLALSGLGALALLRRRR